ncbi:MAG: helix-turn-helix domain-containing protein [Gammaproteobacteria bacterium]|nr:helix-turn-helix domain-containing protein [Gammaproteobacteria bacterium]
MDAQHMAAHHGVGLMRMAPGFESYSTSNVAPHRRVDFWNEHVSGAITTLQVQPARDGAFDAQLKTAEFGGIRFVEIACSPTRVMHTPERVHRVTNPAYLLQLQRCGTCIHRALNIESLAEPGDYFLCDNTVPYEQVMSDYHDVLVLRLPQASLKRRLPTPELFLGRRMSGGGGTSGLVSKFISLFWEQCEQGMDALAAEKIVDSICDLLATSFIDSEHGLLEGSTVQAMWRVRICRFIDQHLGDPELDPARIASHFRISPRYIHKLFEHQDEAVSRYILRRRLEAARRSLVDVAQGAKTVSAIAYEWGFSNTTHFARVFRDRFGAAPSDLRRSLSSART